MRVDFHRYTTKRSGLLTLGTVCLIGVAVVGTSARASTGGTATARAADVTVGTLTVNASATAGFEGTIAKVNGDEIVTGGAVQTEQVTTPNEPAGGNVDGLASVDVPAGAPVVTLDVLFAG